MIGTRRKISRYPWILGVSLFALGWIVGALLPDFSPLQRANNTRESGYSFISPLLACADEDAEQILNNESDALQDDIISFVTMARTRGDIADAGVYFRELDGGTWLGVNFEESFTPGSLLKVPLAMAVYRRAMSDPAYLSQKVLFDGNMLSTEPHYRAPIIEAGKEYTIDELVEALLKYSDNAAAVTLVKSIGEEELTKVYAELGIEIPSLNEDYSMSVRRYASFFRILYNATYIDRIYSERILSILSESAFTQGVVAGVPTGTVVAHKFGERALQGSGVVQLHDCGIVYKIGNPYLLCVMLRGDSYDELSKTIERLSRLVYERVQ